MGNAKTNFWDDRIRAHASARPHDSFISDPRGSATSLQYEEETSRLLATLTRLGIGSADRLLTTLPRGTALALISGAALRGSIPALTMGRYEVSTGLESVSRSLEPRAIVYLATDSTPTSPFFNAARIYDEDVRVGNDLVPIKIAIHEGDRKPGPGSLSWLLQTSGSTREPRLVMISDENLVTRAQGEVRDFKLTEKDELLNFLTFAHDLGFNQFLSALASGAKLRIQNQPFIASLAQSLSQNTTTGITGTPLMWKQLFQHVDGLDSKTRFTSPRFVTVSGGSLDQASISRLQKIFPLAEVLRTYGQTETFRSLLHRGIQTHSLGRPIQDVHLSLTDKGELLHRGAGQMMGYFANTTATTEKVGPDGIRTGDLFRIDSGGEYHYLGRMDDMVKRFEYRLHLGEIEDTIRLLSDVKDVVLIARPASPGDIRETLLRAYVVAAKASSETAVLTHCKAHLAPNKIPDSVRFVDALPVTESRKVDRQKLLREWMDEDGK